MIKEIEVPVVRDRLWMDTGVVYANVPGWCGHVTANLKMTVIYHDSGDNKKYPCLLWVCGGGWKWMNAESYLPNLIDLCHAGYVLVSAEYQCSNDALFPAQLCQLKEAVRYLRANADRYGIDKDHFGVIGESSGGHLATLLGVTNGRPEFERGSHLDQSSAVSAVCSWYTPIHLVELVEDPIMGDLVKRLFSENGVMDEPLARTAEPEAYISEHTPPFLLFHGTADALVPIQCSEQLYHALEKKGVCVQYYRIKGADHADYSFFQRKIMNVMQDFFDQYI